MNITNHTKNLLLLMVFISLLTACATPMNYTTSPLVAYDKDTDYRIDEQEDGFIITVAYSRYQFIPESSAVSEACKSQLTSIAWEQADNLGKEIEQINEQRIRISMGRNGLSGITSCHAQVVVKWAKPQSKLE